MLPLFAGDEFTSLEAWRATFAEFVATLLFVFLGAGSVVATGAALPEDLDKMVGQFFQAFDSGK